MTCDQAIEAITAAEYGEASEAERSEVEAHLFTCTHCRVHRENIKKLATALRSGAGRHGAAPPEFIERVRATEATLQAARAGKVSRRAAVAMVVTALALGAGGGYFVAAGGQVSTFPPAGAVVAVGGTVDRASLGRRLAGTGLNHRVWQELAPEVTALHTRAFPERAASRGSAATEMLVDLGTYVGDRHADEGVVRDLIALVERHDRIALERLGPTGR